jgi:hypothetical protein
MLDTLMNLLLGLLLLELTIIPCGGITKDVLDLFPYLMSGSHVVYLFHQIKAQSIH